MEEETSSEVADDANSRKT